MKIQSLGFIGGGRITRIFLQAFKNKNASWDELMVFDTNKNTSSELKRQYPDIRIVATAGEAAQADVVFIALHPPVIMESLAGIKEHIKKDAVVVSLAPKITSEKIRTVVEKPNIMRLIPNATSFINEGYNPFCFAEGFESEKKMQVISFLDILGKTFEAEEHKLEGYAIVSAMLPTYFWFQWKKMIEIGTDTALTEQESIEAVHQTLQAAIDLMFKSGLGYDEVTDLIPVKPVAENEAEIRQIFQEKLTGLYHKIKP